MPELKPCPFCGAEPTIYDIDPHKHDFCGMPDHPGSTVIECGCGAGLIDEIRERVIERWNRRPETAEWQPIATAPMDGTEILVSALGYGTGPARFSTVAWFSLGGWRHGSRQNSNEIYPPTHWMWMPLPPAPGAEGGV